MMQGVTYDGVTRMFKRAVTRRATRALCEASRLREKQEGMKDYG